MISADIDITFSGNIKTQLIDLLGRHLSSSEKDGT